MTKNLRHLPEAFKAYFNLNDYKEDEAEVNEQVRSGVVFRGPQLWILMFAILIASLGLNVNSTAVIIGAMLISPLMGPILGIGFSVGIYDFRLFKQSLKNYLVATVISVVTATLFFLLSPLSEAQSELLARTSPTLYDVLIAFFGGAAGVLALTTKGKGQVIPGVAIATALMPPLCTAGYGLATAQWSYFFGAFYLFFINTVFIALSTFLGVKLMKFKKNREISAEQAVKAKRYMTALVVVTLIPAAFMTWSIIRDETFRHNVNNFVKNELQQSGTQILSTHAEHDTLQVVAIGRIIDEQEIASAQRRMPHYSLGKYTLTVIQGNFQDSLQSIATQLHRITASAEGENRNLRHELEAAQDKLNRIDGQRDLASHLNSEALTLFPDVERIHFGFLVADGADQPYAVVGSRRPLPAAERDRLGAWLRTRTGEADLQVIFQ